jgi:glutaredoxin 2
MAELDFVESDNEQETEEVQVEEGASTADKATVPLVVKFAFKEFQTDKNKGWAKCKFCKTTIRGKLGTTTGYTRNGMLCCRQKSA